MRLSKALLIGLILVGNMGGCSNAPRPAQYQPVSLQAHSYAVRRIVFSPNSDVFATCGWWEAKVWDTRTLKVIRTLSVFDANVGSVAFSPDGSYLLVALLTGMSLMG